MGEPISYTNRKGKTYYLHQSTTKTGKPRYTMKAVKKGAETELPDGYEITENVNGQVSVGIARPRQITEIEEQFIRDKLAALDLRWYRCQVKDACLIIYEPITSYEQAREVIEAFMDPIEMMRRDFGHLSGFDNMVEEITQSDAYRAYLNEVADPERRQAMVDQKIEERFGDVRVEPVLQFELVDAENRRFWVHRMCFTGEPDWLPIDPNPLSINEAADRYMPHLGQESFFELL